MVIDDRVRLYSNSGQVYEKSLLDSRTEEAALPV